MQKKPLFWLVLGVIFCATQAFSQGPTVHPDFNLIWVLDSSSPYFDSGPAWQEALAGGWDVDGDGVGEFYSSFDGSGDPAKNYILREFQPSADGSGFDMVWSFEVDSMVQQAANQRVIALGDVNGNGVNELLFGVTPIDPNDPNLFVFEVSNGALPTTPTAGLITPRPTHEFLNADSTVNKTFLHWMWEEPWVISDIDGDGQNEFVGTGSGVMVMEFSGDWTDPNAPDDVNFEFVDPGPDETVRFGAPGIIPEKFATAITAGDLDGDGDKDLIAIFPGWRHFGNDNETFTYKERPLRVFETTGEDSYNLAAQLTLPTSMATDRTPAWTGFTPFGWMGANRGIVALDLDNDGQDEIFHTNVGGFAGVGGSLWVIDLAPGKTIAQLDSTDIHLLVEFGDFLPEGTNSATHGMGVADMDGDGNIEFYVADLDARRVWRVEYQGGSITDPANYITTEIFAWPDGTQPKTLTIGQDMDNDGKYEIVIQGPPGNEGGNIVVLESNQIKSQPGLELDPEFNLAWVLDSSSPYFDSGPAWQEALAGGWDVDGDGVGEFYSSFDGSGDPAKNYILREFQPSADGSGFDMVWSFEVDSMVQQAANQRVIALGDVNGNGVNELLFGVTPIDPNDPNLFVFEVSNGALPTTPTAGLITPRPTHEFLNADSTVNKTFLHWMWEEPWVISDIDGDGQNEFVGTGSGVMVMEFSGDWTDPNAPDDVNFEFVDPGPDETVRFGAPGIIPEKFATAITAGDLDGDGDKDLIAIFPGWRHFGNDNETFTYKERPLRVFETTGEDSYNLAAQLTLPTSMATDRTPAWTGFTPFGWMGANRGIVALDLDNDGQDEIFHTNVGGFAGVGGSLWVIDLAPGKTIAQLDSTDIHLLVEFGDFLPEGTNSATHGMGVADMDGDGNIEFYVADLDARRVWQVEYQGGDITDPANYTTKQVMHFEDGTQPKTLQIGQDMDNDGKPELIIQGPPGNIGGNIIVLERALPTSVENSPTSIPKKFELAQNYPNPFNPTTTIKYTLAKATHVKLIIYNLLGEEIVRLVDKVVPEGAHTIVWDGRDRHGRQVSTGVYLYTLETDNFKQTRKMLLLK